MCKVNELTICRFPNKLRQIPTISLQIVNKQQIPSPMSDWKRGLKLLVKIFYGCSVKPKTR